MLPAIDLLLQALNVSFVSLKMAKYNRYEDKQTYLEINPYPANVENIVSS
jgi:hypothetical protein